MSSLGPAPEHVDLKELSLAEDGSLHAQDPSPKKNSAEESDHEHGTTDHSGGTTPPQAANPLLVRLILLARRLQPRALSLLRAAQRSPALALLARICRLAGLTLVVLFVVLLASWFMVLSHWFTVVFGHIVLHYTVPAALDDQFPTRPLELTALFAALGAVAVNVPPFAVFVLAMPWTFDRAVLERGGTAPVNELVQRVTPHSRPARLFIKYAPRLAAGPIGCVLFRLLAGEESEQYSLDPLHAAMAGLAGEVTLSGLGQLKNSLRARFRQASETAAAKDTLPI